MLDDRKNNSVRFLVGLGFGALARILFAPKSGRETRKSITDGVDDARDSSPPTLGAEEESRGATGRRIDILGPGIRELDICGTGVQACN